MVGELLSVWIVITMWMTCCMFNTMNSKKAFPLLQLLLSDSSLAEKSGLFAVSAFQFPQIMYKKVLKHAQGQILYCMYWFSADNSNRDYLQQCRFSFWYCMNELLLTIHPLCKRLFGWIELLARLSFETDYRVKNEGKNPVIFKCSLESAAQILCSTICELDAEVQVLCSKSVRSFNCNWVISAQCETWLMSSTFFRCLIIIYFSYVPSTAFVKRFLRHFKQVLQGQLELWLWISKHPYPVSSPHRVLGAPKR